MRYQRACGQYVIRQRPAVEYPTVWFPALQARGRRRRVVFSEARAFVGSF